MAWGLSHLVLYRFMERQLFSWENWDMIDTMAIRFEDVKLKVQIGDFPAGTQFECATIDFDIGLLRLINGKESFEYKLAFQLVGPWVDGE